MTVTTPKSSRNFANNLPSIKEQREIEKKRVRNERDNPRRRQGLQLKGEDLKVEFRDRMRRAGEQLDASNDQNQGNYGGPNL